MGKSTGTTHQFCPLRPVRVQLTQFFSPTSQTSGLVPFLLPLPHDTPVIMFPKTALTFLLIGALSVNALTAPVARSPTPEPECEFPVPYHISPRSDLGPLQQPKNSRPGCSSAILNASCSRVSPRSGLSGRDSLVTFGRAARKLVPLAQPTTFPSLS